MATMPVEFASNANQSRERSGAAVQWGILILLILGGTLFMTRSTVRDELPLPVMTSHDAPSGWTSDFVPAEFPSESADGVLLVEVMPGAYDAFANNQRGYIVPSVVRLKAGDRIVIDNKDSGAHMIFFTFVPPDSRVSMIFPEPGTFAYSTGCAANPEMDSFTTIIVSA